VAAGHKGLWITVKRSKKVRAYTCIPIAGGEPHALTPEGYAASRHVAPDGKTFLALRPADWTRFSVADQWWESGKRRFWDWNLQM